ncbi:hypothetical protein TNIN_144231 [Trichonephila inaurata madagascariensis]|uniref:Uncharacterized protein n=1 Tax=Trichonephila inaurata madagascariensis TaxID=2747483 RepID=A0A8X6Y7W7_9ARAC|nr:hypothetical protein TNIN_144231 [Trichonephila inaurata madagascariensis]
MRSIVIVICVFAVLSVNMAHHHKKQRCFNRPCPEGMHCVYKSTGSIRCHHPAEKGDKCSRAPIDGFYVQFPPCGNGTKCSGSIVLGVCE